MSVTDSVACLEDVGLSHDGGQTFILRHVSLSLLKGEFVALLGPSGVGKSTLLRVFMGLSNPTEGQVTEASQSAAGVAAGQREAGKRRAQALVFQDARLMPWRSVLGNVMFGLEGLALTRKEKQARALAALRLVGLEEAAERWPRRLSGGQRQRVGVARALTVDPDLLLMDEPFGALDPITRSALQDELLKIWQQTHKTVLFVTHDIEEAMKLATRIVVLSGSPAGITGELKVEAGQKDPHSSAFKIYTARLRAMIAGEADPGGAPYWHSAEI
ncbi:ABC transporter ATP-binding protein [Acetobacter tropicalis]|uniref:ABC transporter n=2 Tax=Acetobacter tropicalis TaxID=104102 RepID=A0A094YXL8_9PROT|nr:ABC transporter ATP-binding protein [Acetobacter tropicalis]GBR71924.1 nitrate/sulfonate/bicarbonate transporter ATP-binding protein [Acetobacter tropicalis NRIC 0312]KAA8392393.1 ABC transporter ATP-binding protein [Acetobacter tropicalis]KGB26152.1 ABC-type nitrate/sulfonate/bicarbonate transport system ATPase component [Acetobacter tropicalis]KXV48927.1 ABC transporter [Acetobacter tropicalis]